MRRFSPVVLTLLVLASCNQAALSPTEGRDDPVQLGDAGDAGSGDAGSGDSGAEMFPVEIGIPDPIVSSTFVELDEEGDVTIQDGGQGGTHALIALRFRGLGQWIYYNVAIRDLTGGDGQVVTPDLVRPRPTLCDDERYECRLSPILVVIGGLADREVWDGLHVEISATVANEDGESGTATTRAYLRR